MLQFIFCSITYCVTCYTRTFPNKEKELTVEFLYARFVKQSLQQIVIWGRQEWGYIHTIEMTHANGRKLTIFLCM